MDMTPTNNFIATLTQTPIIATQLSNNFAQMKQTTDTVIQYLSYPQDVSNDLNTLSDTLQTASELLTFVSVVPEVGEAAAALNEAVTAMSEEVTPAKEAAASLAAEVKPILSVVQDVDNAFAKGQQTAQDVANAATTFLNNFTTIVNCINALPSGQAQDTAQTYLNQFSTQVEPDVTTLNTGMAEVNNVVNSVAGALTDLENQLSPLQAIDSAINSVLSALNPVISLMNSLKNDLENIEIPIPIPYPHMVSLYDVFSTLGDFISLAMAPIQDLVNDLLNALNITLPSIPNLSYLLNLNITLPDLPDFDSLVSSIVNLVNTLENDLKLFNLSCPPSADQTDFLTQIKG